MCLGYGERRVMGFLVSGEAADWKENAAEMDGRLI